MIGCSLTGLADQPHVSNSLFKTKSVPHPEIINNHPSVFLMNKINDLAIYLIPSTRK